MTHKSQDQAILNIAQKRTERDNNHRSCKNRGLHCPYTRTGYISAEKHGRKRVTLEICPIRVWDGGSDILPEKK